MNPGSSSVATQPLRTSHDTALALRASIVLKTLKGVCLSEGNAAAAHGVVTLHGRVRTSAERARAGLAVASIDGVHGVRNHLEVSAEPSARLAGETGESESNAPAPPLPDQTIKERIEAAVRADKTRKLEGLKVTEVNHGVVLMSAKDLSLSGSWRAVELAWDAAGTAPEGEPTQSKNGVQPGS